MISATLSATNGHSSASQSANQPWMRETVQAFFEGVNWSGVAMRSAASATAIGDPSLGGEMPLNLTVGQFFETMSWEGKPTIGVPIAPLEAPSSTTDMPSDDLTLDDFSSLFG
ncbi:hypothetical protein GFS31_35620 [Leptolyngbya sp. BL0902]|uniref:hypothetical protein n=1 Tax=Leptolyngbya sp. BL0902 TaxID=1115757 RepID=UPI0018E88123|nr:hypothetical protein [Leptolyngbya sp. BL0902]QQE66858.1 hypothetical protein GFS31_35620 [Leptolyngbya sp. BL0902]